MSETMSHNRLRLLLVAAGALLFVPFIGSFHLFDWDEINFAESAREMLLTGRWRMVQIDFQAFYEKPPLFIWLQAISMKFLGVNEFAARLPNAVFGIVTLVTVQNIGEKLYSRRLGLLWAAFFACSFLPALYFKSGIIDPVFNYFIFLSLAYLFRATRFSEFESRKRARAEHNRFLLTSAVAMGLAILTKGPVALLLVMLTVLTHFILSKGRLRLSLGDLAVWMLTITLIVAAWLTLEVKENGMKFIDEFIRYQVRLFSTPDAGHAGPWYFHPVVVFAGCFPASVFALYSLSKDANEDHAQTHFRHWMIILLAIVLIVFSLVKTKIIHYSSLAFFPVTFLAANALEKSWRSGKLLNKSLLALLLGLSMLLVAVFVLFAYAATHPQLLEDRVKNDFVLNCIRVNAAWNATAYIPAGFMFGAFAGFAVAVFRNNARAFVPALVCMTGCIISAYSIVVPRVEKHVQHTYIEMLKAVKSERATHKVFVLPAGFKSYAHLFYFEKPMPGSERERNPENIIWGEHDGVVYLIGKTPGYEKLTWLPKTEIIRSENGWTLLRVVR